MSKARINALEERLQQEEKRFLMERYVSVLLPTLESIAAEADAEPLDDRTVESLQVARPYLSVPLAERIVTLLTAQGHEVEDLEEVPGPSTASTVDTDDGEKAEYGGLFDDDDDDDNGDDDAGAGDEVDADDQVRGAGTSTRAAAADGEVAGEDGIDAGDGLFDGDGDELFGGNAGGLFDDDDDDDTDGLLAEPESPIEASAGEEADTDGLFDEDGSGDESGDGSDLTEDARDIGLFDDAAEPAGGNGAAPRRRDDATGSPADEDDETAAPSDEDEDAGVLFGNDIYSGHGRAKNTGQNSDDDLGDGPDPEDTPGLSPAQGKKGKKTPRSKATKGRNTDDTPGFTPTKDHDIEDTPGFNPTEGHDTEDTPGFKPTRGHDIEDTPGFITSGVPEERDTPGFVPVEGHDIEETPGFVPARDQEDGEAPETNTTRKRRKLEATGLVSDDDAEAKKLQARKDRQEKLKIAQEARRARLKQALQPVAEPEAVEEEEEEELELDNLTHQISLDDLEQYLDISIIPDDRNRLERRWQQKMRDPSLRHLLADKDAMAHGYALIPRLPRYFRGGQTVSTNLVNLLRNFPQLFDNVAQVISKYRAEPFFVRESPELDWAIVAIEVLPESRGRNYMEQKVVIKQYAQKHQTNERRIQRRQLVDVLYDAIVVNAITKDQILSKTVDLTETKVGRQNFACINFGEKGIRINDVGRNTGHQQMGICPSW
ncbi:MAG: hypothetical protein O2782_10130 [bacterium]|nr:hypothetical protein [bacterium]